MSEFYARVQGGRGEVTRTGSKNSGIAVKAETWVSVVETRMFMDEGGVDGHGTRIAIYDKHGNFTGFDVFLDTDALARLSSRPEIIERCLGEVEDAINKLNREAQTLVKMQRSGVKV